MVRQISPCLKYTFTVFNIIFALIGAVIIAVALRAQLLHTFNGELELWNFSLHVLYIVGSITMVIGILGAYGACMESKMSLVLFLVCMVLGSMLMLLVTIPAAIIHSKLNSFFEDSFREMLPLDKASEGLKDAANATQTMLQCCGLFSYNDWEGNIPDSCLCNREEEMEGKCQTVTYGKSIYIESCFPIIMKSISLYADVAIGVIFTLAILALLGLILSSVLIHQMRYQHRPTFLVSVPTTFTASPPKYKELHNPLSY